MLVTPNRNSSDSKEQDIYDAVPPEILDQILVHLDHATLYNCATLSKRWSQRVIPHLWYSPFMIYYISWMRLLHTISHANRGGGPKSPKGWRGRRGVSTSPVASPNIGSLPSPPPEGARAARMQEEEHGCSDDNSPSPSMTVRDPYGRVEGSPESLVASGRSVVRGWGSPVPSQDDVDMDGDREDSSDGDNKSDDGDDGDLSGLLRLAESQRQNQVQVGWGGNCTSEREDYSPTASALTSPTTATCSHALAKSADQRIESIASNVEFADVSILPSLHSFSGNMAAHAKSLSTHHLPTRAPPPPTPFIHPAYGHLIRVLDFSHLYYIISDKFLTHLLPQTPLLLDLTITSPKQFSDDSLLSLSLSCPLLRRLELQSCPKISDKGMEYIFEGCQNIHTLVLSNRGGASSCSSITDKTLSHLAHSTCAQSTLRVLNLSNASPFITGQNPGLLSIALWCPNLISLNISHCTEFVTDELLANLLCAPSLQVLSLAHCQDITDRGMMGLARGCPDLRELDITAANFVTDKGVMEIGRRCQSFRKLVMDDRCGRVTEDALRCFPWGAEVVQRRKMLGWRYSRTF